MNKDTARLKIWRKLNPEKVKEQRKRYREKLKQTNPEKLKEQRRKYKQTNKTNAKRNKRIIKLRLKGLLPKGKISDEQLDKAESDYKELIIKGIVTLDGSTVSKLWLIKAKHRAKRQGYKTDLTIEDFSELPTHCKFLGTELNYLTRCPDQNMPTIDRIDSTKGYMKGNVQIISKLANQMKSAASKEELLNFCRGVLERQG